MSDEGLSWEGVRRLGLRETKIPRTISK